MKVATFNVWHGLAGRGIVRFREFESSERRQRRWLLTLKVLNELDLDIILLQELNPVVARGQELVSALGGQFAGRTDQSGIKIFSLGLPLNLSTGLGILTRKSVRPVTTQSKWPVFVKLSGGFGFSGDKLSLHTTELRYAQLLGFETQSFGRILVANAHLHHGFERFPLLIELLDAAVLEKRVTREQRDMLLPLLDAARDRRLKELNVLLEHIERAANGFDGILIGGDFNAPPEAAAYRLIERAGFTDLHKTYGEKASIGDATWDPQSNFENHRLQDGFQFPLPTFGNLELQKVYRQFDSAPRRIDFLFARGSLVDRVGTGGLKVDRFGFPETTMAPSDHFGVVAHWKT